MARPNRTVPTAPSPPSACWQRSTSRWTAPGEVEAKWDGQRAIAVVRDRECDLFSRNGNDVTNHLPALSETLLGTKRHQGRRNRRARREGAAIVRGQRMVGLSPRARKGWRVLPTPWRSVTLGPRHASEAQLEFGRSDCRPSSP
ncbi:hypothetical protein FXW78_22420 [Rhodococcus opacus]|nr:hypothetical protein [Rhodococcus opacus]